MWRKIPDTLEIPIWKEMAEELLGSRVEGLAARSLSLRIKFMQENLTKLQMNIVLFIGMLSRFCGKDRAIIPKLSDFELCGVSKTKIGAQLEALVEAKVITWEKGTDANYFEIRKLKDWETTPNVGFHLQRTRELLMLNMRDAGIDTDVIIEKILTKHNLI